MTTTQVIITSEEKKKTNNTFTTSHTSNNVAFKLFRADLSAEQQEAVVAKVNKTRRDLWVRDHDEATLLEAEDAAWTGKALLSEAIRFQYSHNSKRLTKTLLERCPLMQHNQRRYEDDVAFNMEEKQRLIMIERALQRLPHVATMSPAELADARDELDCEIDAPEIDARDIVAPMAPELARAMWQDFDLMLGVAVEQPHTTNMTQNSKCVATLLGSPAQAQAQYRSGSLEEIKAKYAQTLNTFTQLQLWRVKRSKCKYQ